MNFLTFLFKVKTQYCNFIYYRYRKREMQREDMLNDIEEGILIPQDETLSEMIDHSSGSGSGLPLLV